MISLQALKAFRSIMEVGSVVGAADRIGRTQPQTSRLLIQLEEELGFKLFIRERKRLVPTERAHRFYTHVLRALEHFEQLKFYGELMRQEHDAYLRVVAPPYAAYTILPEAMARYREAYPNGRFSVELATRSTVGMWVSSGQFDIGIASLPFDAPSIEVTPLAQVPTVVVMPAGHPLAEFEVVTLEELARYPVIALNKFTLIRRQIDDILQREGVELNIIGEADTGFGVCTMCAQGLGVAIVDRLWLDAAPRDRVTWRPWKPGKTSSFGLIRPASGPLSAPAAFLAETVADIFARRFADG